MEYIPRTGIFAFYPASASLSMIKKTITLAWAAIFCWTGLMAQSMAIGEWATYTSLKDAIAVADAGDQIFCAANKALFSYNKTDGSIMRYSKANGLSDVNLNSLYFDNPHQLLFVGYKNGGLDVLQNGMFLHLPDIKLKNSSGDKTIYSISPSNTGRYFYLSCGFGIVLYDAVKNEIKETWYIGASGLPIRVFKTLYFNNKIYAATEAGLAVANISDPNLINYQNWNYLTNGFPAETCNDLVLFNDKLYAQYGGQIVEIKAAGSQAVLSLQGWHMTGWGSSTNQILITELSADSTQSRVLMADNSFNESYLTDPKILHASAVLQEANGTIWIADEYTGLIKYNSSEIESILPNCPLYNSAYDINYHDHTIWVAAGAVVTGNYQFNPFGFSAYKDNFWTTFDRYTFPILDTVYDIHCSAFGNDGHNYFGSFGGGLIDLYNGQISLIKQAHLAPTVGDPSSYRVGGLAFDNNQNLWMTNHAAQNPIVVKKADGTWQRFGPPVGNTALQKLMIDHSNQLWCMSSMGGIVIYNYGNDISVTTDDKWRYLQSGLGNGNLPTNTVTCMAEDKDGQVWVGTTEGIGVFYSSADVLNSEAQQVVFTAGDSIPGYLFGAEIINDIEVDGGNRKWVATNHGVWLMSADGLTELEHFNTENSPLLSDEVSCIGINGETGEVFFGTDQGICSYRGTASIGSGNNDEMLVFPNPVRHEYEGPVAIKGLVDDAFVKITDVNGALLYSTRANGGTATWNGKDLSGNRPATGVYLVFSTNKAGNETKVGKFLFMR